jgi:hypothetical protein
LQLQNNRSRVAVLYPDYFLKLDADPRLSEKLDPDAHLSEKLDPNPI